MNITTDIEEKYVKESNTVKELAMVIDALAFEPNRYYTDFSSPLTHYWGDRRKKATLLAEKILKEGYVKALVA